MEENLDRIFEAASQSQAILKKVRQEKIKEIGEKTIIREFFNDLEIVYHGSERGIKNKYGSTYSQESILI